MLISYDEETGRLVGEIINVCDDEKILDDNGKIDLSKFSDGMKLKFIVFIYETCYNMVND